jgi:hypothetical protein
MMKGSVQIIKTSPEGEETTIYQNSNLVVDGGREAVVQMLSFVPPPDDFENGASAVSSFQIQGWSLGCAKDCFSILKDSRFVFSSLATSGEVNSLLIPSDRDYFESMNMVSSHGFNQWQYAHRQDPNILTNKYLTAEASGWVTRNLRDQNVTQTTENFGGRNKLITTFEYNRGGARTHLTQQAPIRLGADYSLFIEGKAREATLDFRIGRGKEGKIFEYYDFTSNRFVPADSRVVPSKTLTLPNYYDITTWRFKLEGHEVDQPYSSYSEYFVEFLFPSLSYKDKNFAPWSSTYVNPYISISRIELRDSKYQILRNPNFIEQQSKFLNNDFRLTHSYTAAHVPNPAACAQENLVKYTGWETISPLTRTPDPREQKTGLGAVRKFSPETAENTAASGNYGVVLYTSSVDITTSGAASIFQTRLVGDDANNLWFDGAQQNYTLGDIENDAFGIKDNNRTWIVGFDAMVSGPGTLGDCEVSVIRESDGFEYVVAATKPPWIGGNFQSQGVPYKAVFSSKETWQSFSFPVMFDLNGGRDGYTVVIKGNGRTDSDGFANYFIKNFRFGPIEGWNPFVYPVNHWSQFSVVGLNSTNTYPQWRGTYASSLEFSSYNYYASIPNFDNTRIDDIREGKRNQLVQVFDGLQPTKSYALNLKSTVTNSIAPSYKVSLRARARAARKPLTSNLLGSWYQDAVIFSSTTPPQTNVYFSGSGPRLTYPRFAMHWNSEKVTPRDWGIMVNSVPANGTPQTVYEDFRVNASNAGNPGNAGRFSVETYQRNQGPLYVSLSAIPNFIGDTEYIMNWETGNWDIHTPGTPTWNSATSANHLLPIKTGKLNEWAEFIYPKKIPLDSTNFVGLTKRLDTTPDGFGRRGDYLFRLVFWSPIDALNSGDSSNFNVMFRKPKFLANPLDSTVDLWKQKFYNFNTGEWSSEHSEAELNFTGVDGVSNTGWGQSNPIRNMCFAGLDEDTQYQLNIRDADGGNPTGAINEISLCDISFMNHRGDADFITDADVFTSEPYLPKGYFDYEKGTVLKYGNTGAGAWTGDDPSSPSSLVTFSVPSVMGVYEGLGGADPESAAIATLRFSEYGTTTKTPWFTHTIALDEYDLSKGDEVRVGLEALPRSTETGAGVTAKATVVLVDGDYAYTYDANDRTWARRQGKVTELGLVPGEAREQSIPMYVRGTTLASADTVKHNNLLTVPCILPKVSKHAKLIVSVRFFGGLSNNSGVLSLKSVRLYRKTTKNEDYRVSGSTFRFPEFPNPSDEWLQTPGASGQPDEKGQLLNRIQHLPYIISGYEGVFSSTIEQGNVMAPSLTGERSLEEAVMKGGYLPSAGLYLKAGTFGDPTSYVPQPVVGTLNTYGVVNSDGYIYRNPLGRSNFNSIADASAGFIVSSYSQGASKTVRYVLKLTYDEWKFLDYYMGGIGAMGLHTIDYPKTYNKLNNYYFISGTGYDYDDENRGGLYKVDDPARNPVFKLYSKKVLFPPGLFVDDANFITIIWDMSFL